MDRENRFLDGDTLDHTITTSTQEAMMSIEHYPHPSPARTASAASLVVAGGAALAVTRIVMGLIFAWAFLDKTFGFGYATKAGGGWANGGSPTRGFLDSVDHGPFESMFHTWAGQAWIGRLFMISLAAISIALLLGVALRVTAVAGSVLMALMWIAEWPLDKHTSTGGPTGSTNPLFDYHVVYALVLVLLAVLYAGDRWGLGKQWSRWSVVTNNRWLL